MKHFDFPNVHAHAHAKSLLQNPNLSTLETILGYKRRAQLVAVNAGNESPLSTSERIPTVNSESL